ncbi:MAG: hypothetical protein AAGC55_04920 [Myxococcota bacterium]
MGCDDFASPAELERNQLAAIRAEPPGVMADGQSSLEVLVLGPDGAVDEVDATWSTVATTPDVPAIGRVDAAADATHFIAPEQVDEVTIASVEVRVATDGDELVGVKTITVGVPLDNPTIRAVTAAGQTVADGEQVAVGFGDEMALAVDFESQSAPESEDVEATYAWYSTVGTIARYLDRDPVLEADETGTGWVYVVARDGLGGVAWQGFRLTIE